MLLTTANADTKGKMPGGATASVCSSGLSGDDGRSFAHSWFPCTATNKTHAPLAGFTNESDPTVVLRHGDAPAVGSEQIHTAAGDGTIFARFGNLPSASLIRGDGNGLIDSGFVA